MEKTVFNPEASEFLPEEELFWNEKVKEFEDQNKWLFEYNDDDMWEIKLKN